MRIYCSPWGLEWVGCSKTFFLNITVHMKTNIGLTWKFLSFFHVESYNPWRRPPYNIQSIFSKLSPLLPRNFKTDGDSQKAEEGLSMALEMMVRLPGLSRWVHFPPGPLTLMAARSYLTLDFNFPQRHSVRPVCSLDARLSQPGGRALLSYSPLRL